MNHIVYWVTLPKPLKDILLSSQTDPSLSNLFIYLSFSPSPDILTHCASNKARTGIWATLSSFSNHSCFSCSIDGGMKTKQQIID